MEGYMALENKLGITDSAELARTEEKISKIKAIGLYESDLIGESEVGRFSGLAKIHKFLFDEIYDFAGKVRTVNIAKGNFRFAPVMYFIYLQWKEALLRMWKLKFYLKMH